MTAIQYQKDQNNIVHLILNKPDSSANLMDTQFCESLTLVVDQLTKDDFIGVVIRSTKLTFFAGGDLEMLYQADQQNAQQLFAMTESIKKGLRQIECLGKPVVACINGAALGGGWEIALAAHYRIAVNHPKVVIGLPEVTLGLLPGGGGITRTVRMLGLQAAMPLLLEGKKFKCDAALEMGLINEIVENDDALITGAVEWINSHPQVVKPWDTKGYRIPGGGPTNPKIAQMLAIAPAMLRKKTAGVLPAPEKILSAMVEGAQVDFDTASEIETRYFVELACLPVTKNIIKAFWFELNEIKSGVSRPSEYGKYTSTKVGILGAGMMGAGIAYSCAITGISVVLKDISLEAAEKGKAYSEKLLSERVACGKMTESKKQSILKLIHTTDKIEDLQGCDRVIEAVFEDRELKAKITQQAESQLDDSAVFASNTSTLPITGLAEASQNPEQFIGLHFFSPVDKMSLVEIIVGEKTSAETLAKSYDFALQIGKTPIVVNDSRGFFTSRVFATFVNEGVSMLAEGVAAASIENAAFLAGFPVGPLAVTDEVSLTLIEKIRRQTATDCLKEGLPAPTHPADQIIDKMLEMGRTGKQDCAGFYDYSQNPQTSKKTKRLWPGLKQNFYVEDKQLPLEIIKQRLLYIMAIETVRCMQEGVLNSSHDANIGSIFGIGYPAWTGGVLQFINYTGLEKFTDTASRLAETFGERFTPPILLIDKMNNHERFE
jgi:3-hydroxyacyl-CoA dehydrogenase/enoyl-CoA hydratase/3-hydroxybutyryl-CoA epimerase